jgi:RNA polymerase sigma-70 factor (ECF subfamily)
MKLPWAGRAIQFEQLALPHLGALYRGARSLSDAETANDLVQETYLRAWKYFESFDRATNCRAWLFRILRNVWTDRWRKNRLEIPLAESEETVVEPYYDWEDEFLKAEFSTAVGRALAELPVEYRWAVLLADVEELSYQEIASILSCPIGTVMSRINRGRKMLARLLRSYEGEQPEQRHHSSPTGDKEVDGL